MNGESRGDRGTSISSRAHLFSLSSPPSLLSPLLSSPPLQCWLSLLVLVLLISVCVSESREPRPLLCSALFCGLVGWVSNRLEKGKESSKLGERERERERDRILNQCSILHTVIDLGRSVLPSESSLASDWHSRVTVLLTRLSL